MKEEDRMEACKSLQEIETDLVYRLIESYESQDVNNVANALELLHPLVEIHKEMCGQHMK